MSGKVGENGPNAWIQAMDAFNVSLEPEIKREREIETKEGSESLPTRTPPTRPAKMLRLRLRDTGALEFVNLNSLGRIDRLYAVMGWGSFNLRNIATRIAAKEQEGGAKEFQNLSEADKLTFQKFNDNLLRKCWSFNSHRSFNCFKINQVSLDAINAQLPKVVTSVGETYTKPTGKDGNLDLSYGIDFSGPMGYSPIAYVADGPSHNAPQVKQVQDPLFKRFNERLNSSLQNRVFKSVDEAQELLEELIDHLSKEIYDSPQFSRPILGSIRLAQTGPTFSFAQIVRIKGEPPTLLTVQAADAMILIKKKNGTFQPILDNQQNTGIGQGVGQGYFTPQVKRHEIESGDEVFGFTDGIGEFLTLKECAEIIDSNKNRNLLLTEFKARILQKGLKFDHDIRDWANKSGWLPIKLDSELMKRSTWDQNVLSLNYGHGADPVNQVKGLKYHHPDNPTYHDDMALFSFRVL